MKTEIPARQVEVCDLCGREGFLKTCDVCGRQYCLVDDGVVTGSWGFTDLCRICAARPDVTKICERFAKKLAPLFLARRDALRKLPKEEAA